MRIVELSACAVPASSRLLLPPIMVKIVQDLEARAGTRGSIRRARERLIDARTCGRYTQYLIEMYAALDGMDFLDAAMQVMRAVAPGSMICGRSPDLGARGIRVNGRGFAEVAAETLEPYDRDHPAAHPGARMIVSTGEPWQPEHCHHTVSLCFWEATAGEALDCILSIHRSEAEEPFNPTELESLKGLHPQIDRARRRVRRIEAERSALHSLEVLVRKLPLAALVLDWELQPVFANTAGRECCARWTFGKAAGVLKLERDLRAVPADLREICRQLKSEWNGGSPRTEPAEHPPLREMGHETQAGWVARISMIPSGGAHPSRPSFLLQFLGPAESATNGRTLSGDGLAMLAELTLQERAVAHQICEGKSNDDIALALGKSIFTVKRQIHSIFRKLRISNRTQLALRLRG